MKLEEAYRFRFQPRNTHISFAVSDGLRRSEVGANIEKRSLHCVKQVTEVRFSHHRAADAQNCVQLVHRAIGLDTQIVLADSLPAKQARFTLITRSCVDSEGHTLVNSDGEGRITRSDDAPIVEASS